MLLETAVSDSLPVGLAAAKQALRVDFDDDDLRIWELLESETRRYEAFCRRVIRRASWRAMFPCWLMSMPIKLDPVRSVTSVSYLAEDGQPYTLPSSAWTVDAFPGWGATVRIRPAATLPVLLDHSWPVSVDLEAGADDEGQRSPVCQINTADRQNILHLVKQIYDNDVPLTDQQMRDRFAVRRNLW